MSASIDPKTCKTCPHFAVLQQECRAQPPTVFPIPAPGGQLNTVGVWPPTREGNWCGQHPMRNLRHLMGADGPVCEACAG